LNIEAQNIRSALVDCRDGTPHRAPLLLVTWPRLRKLIVQSARQHGATELAGQPPTGITLKPTAPADLLTVEIQHGRKWFQLKALSPELRQAIAESSGWRPPAPPPPVTPPPPAMPPLTRKVAEGEGPRGNGVVCRGGDHTIRDCHYDNFEQNIVAEGCGSLSLTNVRSVNAYRDNPAQQYEGQGLYARDVRGGVTLRGCVLGDNGWRAGKPVAGRSKYRHNLYMDFGAPVDMEDCIVFRAPNCGLQTRAGGRVKNCVFIDCGIGIINSMGSLVAEGVDIIGGRYYCEPSGNWGGMLGVLAHHPTTLRDVRILPLAGQFEGDEAARNAGGRMFWGPALSARTMPKHFIDGHPRYKPPGTRKLFACENVLVKGWQEPKVTGDLDGDQSWAGVRHVAGSVTLDYQPILDLVLANEIPVVEGVRRLRDAAAAAVN
jgi:hypothetical protein